MSLINLAKIKARWLSALWQQRQPSWFRLRADKAVVGYEERAGDGIERDLEEMPADFAALIAEVEELRAALANERGEGEPPVLGWVPEFTDGGRFWKSPKMITALLADGWHWSVRRGRKPCGVEPTARAAMRAASAGGAR